MQFWTHYWTNATVREQRDLINRGTIPDELDHTAGEQFRQRGVSPGDTVYVLSNFKGVIHLLGRMVVDAVVDQDEARRRLGYEPWSATEHVLAKKPCEPIHFDLEVDSVLNKQIEFVDPKGGTKPLAFNKRGGVDQQTLRTVRQLTESTAGQFNDLLNVP